MKLKKKIAFFLFTFLLINNFSYSTEPQPQEILNSYEFINEEINEEINDTEINENLEDTKQKGLYSESAILIEAKTGKILFEKNMHDRKYPASTTKALTAIIAIEKCDLKETATASEIAISALKDGYTKANIQVGETFTIEELLNVLILQSANEAANVIAEHISGSTEEFAKLMNEKAKEMGCIESNFVNANGMHDENHYSSAYDLAMIAKYAMKNDTFRKLVVTKECSLPHTEFWGDEKVEEYGERNFKNTNQLLNPESRYYYPYANGIKAGFTTPAKNCLIASSNKEGFELISVVLHAEATENELSARYIDTINLFEYGYNNYNLDDILKEYGENDNYDTIPTSANIIDTSKNNFSNDKKTNIKDETLIASKKESFLVELLEIIMGASILIIMGIVYLIKKNKK